MTGYFQSAIVIALLGLAVGPSVHDAGADGTNTIPAQWHFEALMPGTAIVTNGVGDYGFQGTFLTPSNHAAEVIAETPLPVPPNGYPLPAATHTNVMRVQSATGDSAGVSANFATNLTAGHTNLCIDFMLHADRGVEPSVPPGTQVAGYFNTNGHLMICHALYTNGYSDVNRAGRNGFPWTELNHTPVESNAWARVTFTMDYLTSAGTLRSDHFFRVVLNGEVLTSAKAYRSPALVATEEGDFPVAAGAGETNMWFLCGDSGLAEGEPESTNQPNHAYLSGIVFRGSCKVDDLVVSPPPPDAPAPRTLTVASAYAGALPETVTVSAGTFISAFVTNSPVLNGTTQFICAAGTVAGNAFTQVSPTNVILTLTNDATLTWRWTTNVWLNLQTNGSGTLDRVSGWYALGSNVVITATNLPHHHFTGWSGDTNGCAISSNRITAVMNRARQISANFAIDQHRLVVTSQRGGALPPVGTNLYNYGSVLTAAVTNSPVTSMTTQYVSAGWTATGSLPASGADTNTGTFTLTNNSTLAWQWKTNFFLTLATTGSGTVNQASGWYAKGSNVVITATNVPNSHYHFISWSGTLGGCTIAGNKITAPMTSVRWITAAFGIDSNTITATAGANGSITPSGAVAVPYGSSKTFTNLPAAHYHVASVLVDGSSVGATNRYTFVNVTNAHTIAASFAINQYSLAVVSAFGGMWPGALTTNWGTVVKQYVLNSPVTGVTTQYVCAGASVASNAFTQVSPTNVTITLTNNATLTWRWNTNVWLNLQTSGSGSVNRTSGWYKFGSNVVITATPVANWQVAWSGDTNGCTPAGNTLTVPMVRTRAITATFAIKQFQLVVASARGGAVPPVGSNVFTYGSAIAAAVTNSPQVSGGTTQYVCTGAGVAGNAFTPMSPTNITLTLTNNATLTWQWKTQFLFSATAGPGGTVIGSNGWYTAGTSAVARAVPDAGYGFVTWTGGVVSAQNPITQAMTRAYAILAVFGYSGPYYVAAANTNPVPPYATWATAARTIQDAVDVALSGGEIIVDDGVYSTGGRIVNGALSNRVAVLRPITVRSLNGPAVTHIIGRGPNGSGAVRCVYLTNGVVMSGFTLRGGATLTTGNVGLEQSGGGVYGLGGAVVSNCVISGNSARSYGAGVMGGRYWSCSIVSNTATSHGGGAAWASLWNCLVASNRAVQGAGTYTSTNRACTIAGNVGSGAGGGTYAGNSIGSIIWSNRASTAAAANYSAGTFAFSCTGPTKPSGAGNTNGNPLFVDAPGGNFRLQSTSPCMDRGTNETWMTLATDLDGNTRLADGDGDTVVRADMGAYELPPAGPAAPLGAARARNVAEGRAGPVDQPPPLPLPTVWASSEFNTAYTARYLIDGDTNTVWVGGTGGSPWRVSVDLGRIMALTNLDLVFVGEPWINLGLVGSADAVTWFDFARQTNWPVDSQYLYLNLWHESADTNLPALREIIWQAH